MEDVNIEKPLKKELTDEEFKERMMRWITFYKRNVHRFAQHYLKLKLYPYQLIWLYEMSQYPETTIVATRGSAKSFLIGLYACIECMLRPGLKVIIVSKTMEQSKLIITEKIEGELCKSSPNLKNAITKIDKGKSPQVKFKNGSTIKVVVGGQSARGHRVNFALPIR